MINVVIEKSSDKIIISKLKDTELISLDGVIINAIKDKKQIHINVNLNEVGEILKGTYLAMSITTGKYTCNATLSKDMNEMNWICEPISNMKNNNSVRQERKMY